MLATLAGFLALLLGLSLLLLPLLVTELSRPRDSAWGAVVLLLGLVLVTSAERLTGAPMLAVLCGGLLVGRLGGEVAQGRWRALSEEERQALRSSERWSRSLNQLAVVVASLVQSLLTLVAVVSAWLAERRQSRTHGKRWVRAESPTPSSAAGTAAAPDQPQAADASSAEAPPASAETAESSGSPLSEPPSPATEHPPGSLAGAEPEAGEARDAVASSIEIAASQAESGSPAPLAADSIPGAREARAASDRPDRPAVASEPTPRSPEPSDAVPQEPASRDPGVRIVSDFDSIDTLLAAAEPGDQSPTASTSSPVVSDPVPSSPPEPQG